ncbi:MAG: cell envelope integrity protein CreD, partial [Burkholderiaceae bacterium]|nr:cell envelope integrity protein CreD [Burkholderiaceae bacterium]
MQKSLFFKIVIIGVVMTIIYIALSMIHSTIYERIHFREEAVRSIATDSVGDQRIMGPVLVLQFTDRYEEEEVDLAAKKTVIKEKAVAKKHLVFPNQLDVKSNVDIDQRYRGIHKVLVYSGQHQMQGDFKLPALSNLPHEKPNSRLHIDAAYIAMGLSDTRGLRNFPKLAWDGESYEFTQGSQLVGSPSGLHTLVKLPNLQVEQSVKFSLPLAIDGMERLQFVPIAKNNQLTMTSKWPHPQFGGRFLPAPSQRKIDANGFSALWNISSLSSKAQQQFLASEEGVVQRNQNGDVSPSSENIESFHVAFIEPVNIYSQADRAIKYGMLFIVLTFAAFFLFEVLKRLPIHPVQYTLVGLSLAIFFLLLLSLSEHMRFSIAYIISASACIALIGFYLKHVLQSWKRGFGFATGLCVLYSVLYGLLQSENNALLMGSILLFAVLAAMMTVTRKLDWYKLGTSDVK